MLVMMFIIMRVVSIGTLIMFAMIALVDSTAGEARIQYDDMRTAARETCAPTGTPRRLFALNLRRPAGNRAENVHC